ncbi:hypothetical protein GCM10017779_10080 [Streptomyces capillispiralis]|nr:hypothetical protein GCM10017779_10080 [Streptomyces capillispiralis]
MLGEDLSLVVLRNTLRGFVIPLTAGSRTMTDPVPARYRPGTRAPPAGGPRPRPAGRRGLRRASGGGTADGVMTGARPRRRHGRQGDDGGASAAAPRPRGEGGRRRRARDAHMLRGGPCSRPSVPREGGDGPSPSRESGTRSGARSRT